LIPLNPCLRPPFIVYMNGASLKAPKVPSDIATLVVRNDSGLFCQLHSTELYAREENIRNMIASALKGK
jgi:hypothetical protein